MSRLVLLLLIALSALVVIACSGGGDPGVTAPPTTPHQTAERWLQLWKDGKYDDMYQLISANAATKISQKDFVDRYTAIFDEAKLTGFDYEIRTSAEQAAKIDFAVTFHSPFFGNFPEVNTIPLVKDGASGSGSPSTSGSPLSNAWKVDWTPSLFFKEINGADLVHFFTRVPRRGTIYDRAGTALAVDADLPVVGIVPDLVTDKEAVISALTQALAIGHHR